MFFTDLECDKSDGIFFSSDLIGVSNNLFFWKGSWFGLWLFKGKWFEVWDKGNLLIFSFCCLYSWMKYLGVILHFSSSISSFDLSSFLLTYINNFLSWLIIVFGALSWKL